jgi:hypothetical protein
MRAKIIIICILKFALNSKAQTDSTQIFIDSNLFKSGNSNTILIVTIPKIVMDTFRVYHPKNIITDCTYSLDFYFIEHTIDSNTAYHTTIRTNGEFIETKQSIKINQLPFTILQGFIKIKPDSVKLKNVYCEYLQNKTSTCYTFYWELEPVFQNGTTTIMTVGKSVDCAGREVK